MQRYTQEVRKEKVTNITLLPTPRRPAWRKVPPTAGGRNKFRP
jgi:hypothetical protein